MAIALLKKLNQTLPDGVKKLAAPIIRRQLIGNQVFLDQYRDLERAELLSEDELNELQFLKLKDALIRAYENVPYYHELFDKVRFSPYAMSSFDDIKKIPFLEKSTIQSCPEALQDETCVDYYTATTGGSTGIATTISLDRASIYKERAFIYHFWKHFGYDFKSSKLATFRGVPGEKLFKLNPLYNEIQLTPFNLSSSTIDSYVNAIDSFGAEYIQGYPSAIAQFCMLAKEKKIQLKNQITAVFLISENILDWQEMAMKDFFSCPLVPFYGHTERSVFAECYLGIENGYSFDRLYGYTEILEDGTIVCTGFINPRMPLIRYMLDDEAILLANSRYKIIGHRDGTSIVGRNGEKITQTSFEGMHVGALSKVRAYQLVQEEKGKCSFLFKAEERLDKSTVGRIVEELNSGIPALTWEAIQVDTFILTDRGKYKPILVTL